jgi:hypothetical protein
VNYSDPSGLNAERHDVISAGGGLFNPSIFTVIHWVPGTETPNTTWHFTGAIGQGGAGGGGAGPTRDVTTNRDRLNAAKYRMRLWLDEDCARAIGAPDSARAKSVFNDMDIGFSDLGAFRFNRGSDGSLTPDRGTGLIARYNPVLGFRNIRLNTHIDWGNPNNTRGLDQNGNSVQYRALDAQATALDISSMTAQEFMDFTLLHELAHRFGQHNIDSDPAVEKRIWRDCLR